MSKKATELKIPFQSADQIVATLVQPSSKDIIPNPYYNLD